MRCQLGGLEETLCLGTVSVYLCSLRQKASPHDMSENRPFRYRTWQLTMQTSTIPTDVASDLDDTHQTQVIKDC
ncbi:hypothetical protein HBI60_255140 [Parastagonospora nodorum]|nr:hypothetical protein HBI60_255140 [Parastagonospora nodorum]